MEIAYMTEMVDTGSPKRPLMRIKQYTQLGHIWINKGLAKKAIWAYYSKYRWR
jgi:hypothetical protein